VGSTTALTEDTFAAGKAISGYYSNDLAEWWPEDSRPMAAHSCTTGFDSA
jgi:hypothetical protein